MEMDKGRVMQQQSFQQKEREVPEMAAVMLPILGICGLSGAGKTTLVEAILPELLQRGLRVAVVKYDCRNRLVDFPGTDSDRLYRAGADVFLLGGEDFVHLHGDAGAGFGFQLSQLARYYDLVLVEGHGQTPVSKVWLLAENGQLPADMESVVRVFPRDEARAAQLLEFILQWLQEIWQQTPVWACVLIGGRSSRMGRPKHLLENIR